ncbi:hypothetical protein ANO11243_087840 [Dothideomycetidae sp. 11243]|nr:hypothetical protein ANO11243_087840 [fungal sp. No.11243]
MSYQQHNLDGDTSGKTLDAGANAGMPHTDLADGVHEQASSLGKPTAAGEKTVGAGKSAFDADGGAIGKQFNADGAIGGMAQKVGGPFDKQGAIGKHFNADGQIGGSVQEHLGKSE